jgi:hypothetical protein
MEIDYGIIPGFSSTYPFDRLGESGWFFDRWLIGLFVCLVVQVAVQGSTWLAFTSRTGGPWTTFGAVMGTGLVFDLLLGAIRMHYAVA